MKSINFQGFSSVEANWAYAFVAILTIPVLFFVVRYTQVSIISRLYVFIVLILSGILFGLRAPDAGLDTAIYINNFEQFAYGSFELSQLFSTDIAFNTLTLVCAKAMDVEHYFLLIAALYVSGIGWYVIRCEKCEPVLLLFGIISLFSFYSLGFNIVKTSLAVALVLAAVVSKNRKLELLLWSCACIIHFSVVTIFAGYLLAKWVGNFRRLVALWILAVVLSALRLDLYALVGNFSNSVVEHIFGVEKIVGYYNNDEAYFLYRTGFRWDFLLFNAVFICVLYYWVKDGREKQDEIFMRHMHLFMGASILCALAIRFPYIDRLALYSWLCIPRIAIGPGADSVRVKQSRTGFGYAAFLVLSTHFWLLPQLREP
jgi:hypothetical protein